MMDNQQVTKAFNKMLVGTSETLRIVFFLLKFNNITTTITTPSNNTCIENIPNDIKFNE